MKQKEILLFGATGQIGRNLIRKLTKNNYKIIAVTRNIHRAGYILKTQANPGYLELVELKNFNIGKLDELMKRCSICINLIGILFEKKHYTFKTIHTVLPDMLSKLANENNIDYDIENMSKNEKVLAEIQAHVDKSNSKVANVQQIKKFTLLSNEWTDSSGELTPSLKLKRHVVTERYKDEIESMYEEA